LLWLLRYDLCPAAARLSRALLHGADRVSVRPGDRHRTRARDTPADRWTAASRDQLVWERGWPLGHRTPADRWDHRRRDLRRLADRWHPTRGLSRADRIIRRRALESDAASVEASASTDHVRAIVGARGSCPGVGAARSPTGPLLTRLSATFMARPVHGSRATRSPVPPAGRLRLWSRSSSSASPRASMAAGRGRRIGAAGESCGGE